MDTLNLTLRYRPVKIGWCIELGDADAFRAAVKMNHCLWGGRFNPIIPIGDAAEATQLVKMFRADVLLTPTPAPAVEQFIAGHDHLPNPLFSGGVFAGSGEDRYPNFVDLVHPAMMLHNEFYKNVADPKLSVKLCEWDPADPLSDLFLSSFGQLPSTEITGFDYKSFLRNSVAASRQFLAADNPVPLFDESTLPLAGVVSYGIKDSYSVQNNWAHAGIYIGGANNLSDLISFWNLRATGTHLVFYDPAFSARLKPRRDALIQLLAARVPSRTKLNQGIAIWSQNRDEIPDIEEYGSQPTFYAVDAKLFNGLNIQCPYFHFSETRVLGALGAQSDGTPRVTFALPDRPFEKEIGLHRQNMVVGIDPGIGLLQNELMTLHVPSISSLNEFLGRNLYYRFDSVRIEPENFGIICGADTDNLTITAINVEELIKKIFSTYGILATPSKAGLIAKRLVRQMGGIQGCRVFKIAGVRHLIENHNPLQSFTRGIATGTIFGKNTESPLALYKDLYIEQRPSGVGLKSSAVFDFLLKKSVFRAGLKFECTHCELEGWKPLDDIKSIIVCEYCGSEFDVTPQLKDRDWAYRRSGLFGRDDHQEGAIPVALTLQQFDTVFHSNYLFTTSMNLKFAEGEAHPCETDFVIVRTARHLDDKVEIVIGECKTRKEITGQDIDNLIRIAGKFPAALFDVYIAFSKIDDFTDAEIRRLTPVNTQHRKRLILFTARELEPYFLYERSKMGDKRIYASSLADMADTTEKLFLRRDGSPAPVTAKTGDRAQEPQPQVTNPTPVNPPITAKPPKVFVRMLRVERE